MFAGKEYPCTVGEVDMGSEDGKKKLKKDLKASHCNTEDASNDKSDDGEGLDKVDNLKQLRKSLKIEKTKTSITMVMLIHLINSCTRKEKQSQKQSTKKKMHLR